MVKCILEPGRPLTILLEEGETLMDFKLCAPDGIIILSNALMKDSWIVLFPNGNRGILYAYKKRNVE